MPSFTVRCVSSKTGKPYDVQISAPGQLQAEDAAAAEGHIIQSGAASGPPPSAAGDQAVQLELRALRAELSEFKDWLGKKKLIRQPIGSIAWGVILGLIFLGPVLFIIGALLLMALGVIGSVHSLSH